jgi:DNA-binding beta-propeller fold protein YncE
MRDIGFTRRQFLVTSGAGAAALGLAGCGCCGGYGYPIEVGIGVGFPIYWKMSTVQLEADASGTLFALDPVARTAARLAPDGSAVWTTPPDSMGMPAAVAFGSDGRIYVADLGRHEIRVLDPNGNEIGRIGTFGPGAGEFRVPSDIAMDGRGWIYVCDSHNHRIQVLDANGGFVDEFGTAAAGEGALNGPCALALDPTGAIHVVDAGNQRIVVFDGNGNFVRTYGHAGQSGLLQPRDIVIDASGGRYVVDGVARCVQSFDALETPGGCLTPVFEDGREAIPLRASLNPAGGIFVYGKPL